MCILLRVTILLASLIVATYATSAEFSWRFPTDRITTEQWTEFRAEVLAMPGLAREEFGNQLVLTSSQERRIYVFTQPAHPAHPAVVVRAVVPRGAGSEVQRMGHYAGDQKAFDRWWHEFDSLDARIPGQIRR
jgi:hypothetical protein